jgi:ATP-dependent protease HslVU (ClpYQ) ATPase subunit
VVQEKYDTFEDKNSIVNAEFAALFEDQMQDNEFLQMVENCVLEWIDERDKVVKKEHKVLNGTARDELNY